ncbi:MAG: hypothetical protein ISR65_00100 [Bacteriovoracaceae bacterium]|nr:hypothetical protein [Bacteriovoracaceae bacterium]
MFKLIHYILGLTILTILCPALAFKHEYKGQISAIDYFNKNRGITYNTFGIRYIPDLTLTYQVNDHNSFDLNTSIDSLLSFKKNNGSSFNLKLYRLKGRLTTPQSDTRIGLQKINFGPAQILRSIKWFDNIDPTDLLKITDGVWGLRFRYYFLNNANIWFWTLYGNNDLKGYETEVTKKNTPEFGGRIQYPNTYGELAFTFHTRQVTNYEKRYAIDGNFDLGVGAWFELVAIDTDSIFWKNMFTVGVDYTFELGSGLYILTEHNSKATTKGLFTFGSNINTTAIEFSYSLNINYHLLYILTHSWYHKQSYHLVRLESTYNDWMISIDLMWNKESANESSTVSNLGKGLQIMIVNNH